MSDLNANQQRQIRRLTADRDALAGRIADALVTHTGTSVYVADCKYGLGGKGYYEAVKAKIRAIIERAKGE